MADARLFLIEKMKWRNLRKKGVKQYFLRKLGILFRGGE